MAQVHVIIGEDEYLVSEAAKRIVGDGIGLETVDSANSSNADLQLRDLREAEASLLTPPFLDPKKTTWWRNVGFLPQSGKGAPSEDVKEALEKFAVKLAAAKLPENQHFILSGPRLMQNSIFAKTLKGAAPSCARWTSPRSLGSSSRRARRRRSWRTSGRTRAR